MAITLAPGQVVASGDWDALFTQHGGMPETTPAVRRSRTEAEMKAAALAGDDDPAAMQRPIYRYVLSDGSYVDARTSSDGAGWEVIDYKPSQTFTQSQTQATRAAAPQSPAEQRTAREEAEIAANAALPPDQDPRPETNAQRAARADATIRQQGQDARQAEIDQRAAEAAARAGRTEEATATSRAAQDQRAAAAEQRANRNPIQRNPVTNELEEIQYDAQGRVTGVRVVSGEQAPATEGPAPPRLEVGQVQTNLRDYLAELNKAVAAKQITPAERTKRWAEAIQQSTAALQEQQNAETARRTNVDAGQSVYAGGVNQRSQDISMSNARLQAATTGFGQLTDAVGQANADLPVGSDAGGKAFAAGLDLQRWNAERMGGMVTPGQVAPPASLTTAAASPSPSPYPLVQAAQSAMGAPAPSPVASVVGSGVPAAIPNTDQMAAQAAQGAQQAAATAGAPLPGPQGPISDPRDAGTVPPSMAAPAPVEPRFVQPQLPSADPGAASPYNPPAGHPGHRPGELIGMTPPPMPVFSPGGTSSMPIVQAAQQAIAPPPGDSWEGTNALLARLGIRPEAIAAARPLQMPAIGA